MDQDEARAEENFREFIERARVTGEVWGLLSDGGWAYCESGEYEDTDVVLFWSDRAAAEKLVDAEWSDHRAVAISLDDFIDRWLCGMDEDGALVGPNWDADLNGLEIDPREIADRLTEDDEED